MIIFFSHLWFFHTRSITFLWMGIAINVPNYNIVIIVSRVCIVLVLAIATLLFTAVHRWLRWQRLHKYLYFFANLSYEEILQIEASNLDAFEKRLGMTPITIGAKNKIIREIETLRNRRICLEEKITVKSGFLFSFIIAYFGGKEIRIGWDACRWPTDFSITNRLPFD